MELGELVWTELGGGEGRSSLRSDRGGDGGARSSVGGGGEGGTGETAGLGVCDEVTGDSG